MLALQYKKIKTNRSNKNTALQDSVFKYYAKPSQRLSRNRELIEYNNAIRINPHNNIPTYRHGAKRTAMYVKYI